MRASTALTERNAFLIEQKRLHTALEVSCPRGASRDHLAGCAKPCCRCRTVGEIPRCAGFEKPSAIQQKGIVPFTKHLDVIQQAQSGTGKTATFCAGILNNLDYDAQQPVCQALVLAPTRELAQQIDKVMNHLGDYLKVKSHACVGGTSVRDDTQTLGRGVHVVVGTPGRVFDMLRRGALRADAIKMFVLDEADEMLSRGFKDQIYDIFRMIPGQLQVRSITALCVPRAQRPRHQHRCASCRSASAHQSGAGMRLSHRSRVA